MKIAVIGGGAAGVMTAHLLDEAHDVSLFEKQALLGGNIRTLGKNLPFPTQREKESSIFLDSGVIEFESQPGRTIFRVLLPKEPDEGKLKSCL